MRRASFFDVLDFIWHILAVALGYLLAEILVGGLLSAVGTSVTQRNTPGHGLLFPTPPSRPLVGILGDVDGLDRSRRAPPVSECEHKMAGQTAL